ncbi:glycosyltransferase family 4 protein [Candidatus Nomurabacteria bacterium]|nr:glycosyltransferase family 4 protein [Candidatus Nomurabacteria bacterium]
MKILIATGIFIPEVGGPATYIFNLAKELIGSGHQIIIVTYSDQNIYDLDQDLPYQVVRVKRKSGFFGKFLNYYNYYKKLKEIYSKENFDIVYSFDHFSAGIPVSILAKKIKKPIIIRVGGDFIWERYLSYAKKPVTLREFYQRSFHLKYENIRFNLIRKVFSQADKIVFTTQFQKEIFAQYYKLPGSKLVLLNNPINTAIKSIERNNFNHNIIFHGRINKKNNVSFLIKAFSQMQNKDFSLQIIGDGPEKSQLENLVAELKLNNVIFLGSLSREETYQKLSRAYLAVYPSLTDISPNGLLESLQLKVPFVCTTEIGFDWLAGKVKMFSPQKIEELIKILDDLSILDNYQAYQGNLNKIDYHYNYSQLAEDTVKILK